MADEKSLGAIHFEAGGQERAAVPTRHCLGQICERVGIPARYADRMVGEHSQLLADNINWWFSKSPEKRMLRTFLNGERTARAFLSNRYRPLDNADLAEAVLPAMAKAGCEVLSSQITETRLYIQAATPRLQLDLEALRAKHGAHARANDIVQAGVVISNSEVGCGALRVEPMLYRLVCYNGLIMNVGIGKYHVGRSNNADLDSATEYFSDSTRELDDKAFWAKVVDLVNGVFDTGKFESLAAKFAGAKDLALPSPSDAVEEVSNRFKLAEAETKSVLDNLIAGSDNSLFGLVNAVTRAAESVESYDRAIELERMGGQILELPTKIWSAN